MCILKVVCSVFLFGFLPELLFEVLFKVKNGKVSLPFHTHIYIYIFKTFYLSN